MKKNIAFLVISMAVLACNKPGPDKSPTRFLFEAGDLQVITSFANGKQHTISLVYGNIAAHSYAATGYQTYTPDAVIKLVTYKQADNQYWYGSYINGTLLSIETLLSTRANASDARFSYRLEYGRPPADSSGYEESPASRIRFILSHKPSVFP